MARPKLDETPPLRPIFERERDPLHAEALNDLNKTEAQRRRESVHYNTAKEKRRESFMVKRQKPKPQLKPEPQLSKGADRGSFNAEWRLEQRLAQEDNHRQASLHQGHQAKAQLERAKDTTDQARQQTSAAMAAKDPDAARSELRDAFKTFRTSKDQMEHGQALAEHFLRAAPTR